MTKRSKVIRRTVGALTAVTAAGAFAAYASWDKGLDIWGDSGSKRTVQEMDTAAVAEARHQFLGAAASRQYEMLFLDGNADTRTQGEPNVFVLDPRVGANGIAGALGAEKTRYSVQGYECLGHTAYDTRPSDISGLRVNGDIHPQAALSVAPDTGNILVNPGNGSTPPLEFSRSSDGGWQPTDATRDTLGLYPCGPLPEELKPWVAQVDSLDNIQRIVQPGS